MKRSFVIIALAWLFVTPSLAQSPSTFLPDGYRVALWHLNLSITSNDPDEPIVRVSLGRKGIALG